MKRKKNEKRMVTFIKKLLPGAILLNPRIETPTLSVRHHIEVDYRLWYKGKEIIFEYNGPHHYLPFGYHLQPLEEAQMQFAEQKKRDEWLRKYCKQKNIILIEVDGRFVSGPNIKLYLMNQLKLLNII